MQNERQQDNLPPNSSKSTVTQMMEASFPQDLNSSAFASIANSLEQEQILSDIFNIPWLNALSNAPIHADMLLNENSSINAIFTPHSELIFVLVYKTDTVTYVPLNCPTDREENLKAALANITGLFYERYANGFYIPLVPAIKNLIMSKTVAPYYQDHVIFELISCSKTKIECITQTSIAANTASSTVNYDEVINTQIVGNIGKVPGIKWNSDIQRWQIYFMQTYLGESQYHLTACDMLKKYISQIKLQANLTSSMRAEIFAAEQNIERELCQQFLRKNFTNKQHPITGITWNSCNNSWQVAFIVDKNERIRIGEARDFRQACKLYLDSIPELKKMFKGAQKQLDKLELLGTLLTKIVPPHIQSSEIQQHETTNATSYEEDSLEQLLDKLEEQGLLEDPEEYIAPLTFSHNTTQNMSTFNINNIFESIFNLDWRATTNQSLDINWFHDINSKIFILLSSNNKVVFFLHAIADGKVQYINILPSLEHEDKLISIAIKLAAQSSCYYYEGIIEMLTTYEIDIDKIDTPYIQIMRCSKTEVQIDGNIPWSEMFDMPEESALKKPKQTLMNLS